MRADPRNLIARKLCTRQMNCTLFIYLAWPSHRISGLVTIQFVQCIKVFSIAGEILLLWMISVCRCLVGHCWFYRYYVEDECMTEVNMMDSCESKSFTGSLLIEEVEGSEKFTSRFFRLNKEIGQLEYFTDDPVKVSN